MWAILSVFSEYVCSSMGGNSIKIHPVEDQTQITILFIVGLSI